MRLLPRAIAPIIILPICSLNPSSAYCSSHSLFPLVSARARDRIHDYYCLIIFTYWFLISKQKEHWPDTSASNLPNEWMNKIGFVLVSCWYRLSHIYLYLPYPANFVQMIEYSLVIKLCLRPHQSIKLTSFWQKSNLYRSHWKFLCVPTTARFSPQIESKTWKFMFTWSYLHSL